MNLNYFNCNGVLLTILKSGLYYELTVDYRRQLRFHSAGVPYPAFLAHLADLDVLFLLTLGGNDNCRPRCEIYCVKPGQVGKYVYIE